MVQGFDWDNKLGNQIFYVTERCYDKHEIDNFIYFYKGGMSYDTLEIIQEKSDEWNYTDVWVSLCLNFHRLVIQQNAKKKKIG